MSRTNLTTDLVAIMQKWADYFGVWPSLVAAIAERESNFQNIPGDYDAAGVPHAYGIMQADVFVGIGVGHDFNDLLNPDYNIRLGTGYLRSCIDAFPGNIRLAVAAYNAGIYNVQIYGESLNKPYVDAVMAAEYYWRNSNVFAFKPEDPPRWPGVPKDYVPRSNPMEKEDIEKLIDQKIGWHNLDFLGRRLVAARCLEAAGLALVAQMSDEKRALDNKITQIREDAIAWHLLPER